MIDAHHHIWDPGIAEYPWLTDELAAIRRRYTPDDLAPLLVPAGVESTVLVQTRSSVEETRDFLATASATSYIRGVVGWVDLTDPSVAEVLAALREGPGGDRLVGIRHQVHDEPDPDWLSRRDVRRGIAAVVEAGLVYDLLVRSRELPAARTLVASMPNGRFVIDHLAKPPIRERSFEPWAALVSAWADVPNTSWKLSGLVTEADWDQWRQDDLAPYTDYALEVLGSDRLMFGSDWPVCLLAATYAEVVEAAVALTRQLSIDERRAVLAENARHTYRLGSASLEA